MEICYYWTESLDYDFKNKGYNFGGELKFTYNFQDKKLKVEENELYIKNFFNLYSDEKIKNLTAVVGRNGVGKSTFLEEIKSLYVQGAILAKKDNKGKPYNHKRILVTKNNGGYEIIYHKDLLTKDKKSLPGSEFKNSNENASQTNNNVTDTTAKNNNDNNRNVNTQKDQENIEYIGGNLKEKYNIAEPIGYSDDNKRISREANIFKIQKLPHLQDVSCIYFSYAFDTNFYNQRTLEESNYYDLSTKGILNEIDYDLDKGDEMTKVLDPTMPNHLSTKNNQFSIGFLREYYARENKKRIKLLGSKIGKSFLEEHKFFPTKVYLNLDYILRRQESDGSLINAKIKNFLRSEKKGETFNPVEREIYNYIEEIFDSKVDEDVLVLAQQTYLRRILDSYFEDVNYFINYDKGRTFLKKSLSTPEEVKNLNAFLTNQITKLNVMEDLIKIINYFNSRATHFLMEFSDNHKDALSDFNNKQFSDMTKSYTDFITYFNNAFLSKSSAVNIKEGLTFLVDIKNIKGKLKVIGTISKRVGLVEIDLTKEEGLPLLSKFLKKYNSVKTGSDFIKIDWANLSTGEDALLGMYSRFYALGEDFQDSKDSGINLSILLDEVEHSLHPEWQRRMINNLIEFLPLAFTTAETIQIIMATNVPFIIADIPTNNIIYLEKKDGKTQIVDKPEQTFAANIHSLLRSNFFMDTTIGKFSEEKIKNVISNLGVLTEDNEGNTGTQSKKRKQLSQEEVKQTIEVIGEPVVKTRLETMYNKHYPKDDEGSKDSEMKNSLEKLLQNPDIPYNVRGRIEEIIRESDKKTKKELDKEIKNDKD